MKFLKKIFSKKEVDTSKSKNIKNDYFIDSIPDGISNAIREFDMNIECCDHDSYEILVMTFGHDVCSDDLKSATDDSLSKFAENMQKYFELSYRPSIKDAKSIIKKALYQWGG